MSSYSGSWARDYLERMIAAQEALVDATRENTEAIREAAQTPQRILHVESREGGTHARDRRVSPTVR